MIVPQTVVPEHCGYNAAIKVSGLLAKSPKAQQQVEIQAQEIKVLGRNDILTFPFAQRKTYPPNYIRSHLHLRPKTDVYSSILRLSSLITTSLHNYLVNDGFVHTFTPILTGNDCEGGGDVFLVKPAHLVDEQLSQDGSDVAYFNRRVYLTVSGQLHLEALTG